MFLGHARGSIFEVQTQLHISGELGFGSKEHRKNAESLAGEVGRIIVSIMAKLKK